MFTHAPLKIHVVIYIIGVFLISSCATKKSKLFNSASDKLADTLKTVLVVNDKGVPDALYRIKPNDQIAIRNLQNIEFGASSTLSNNTETTFIVDADGTANLPVIGRVTIANLTRREATTKLQDLYSKQLLKNPIIEVVIVNLKVNVLGEFTNSGNYVIDGDGMDLVDIIGQAGGLKETANKGKIKIIRGNRNEPEIIYVNLNDIKSLSSPKLILQNNDIIYAEPRRKSDIKTVLTNIQPITALLSTIAFLYTLFTR